MKRLKPLPDRPLQLLHLGDSYTCAEGVAVENGWPELLRKGLQDQGRAVARQQVLARTGWTTVDLLEAVRAVEWVPQWDLVTLCIGVNNQYQALSLEAYREDLVAVFERIQRCFRDGASQALVLSIPDWSITPFAGERDRPQISAQIDTFNSVLQNAARQSGFACLDWTGLSRSFSGDSAFAPDGLHPSEKQHAAWADCLLAKLSQDQTQC